MTARRVAALGLALAIATLPSLALALILAPQGAELLDFLDDHGSLVIAFAALSSLVSALTVGWLVGLRAVLIERSRRWLILDAALIVGVFGFVTALVAYPILAALAYTGPDETTMALPDVAFAVLNLGTGPATAISVAAFTFAIRGSDLGSRVLIALGIVVVAAHLVIALAFAGSGFLSPSGSIAWLAPFLYYLWVAAVSVTIWRRGASG